MEKSLNFGNATLWSRGHISKAYCTGKYLIVWADGIPNHEVFLEEIPKPPGTNTDQDLPYSGNDQGDLRTWQQMSYTYRIPLTPKLSTSGETKYTGFGAMAMAVNGMPLYPDDSTSGVSTKKDQQLDHCNEHAGKGADVHYHGDPSCMYNNSVPTLVGYAGDGFPVYGILDPDTGAAPTDLDECSGKIGKDGSYRYHTQLKSPFTVSCWKGEPPQKWSDGQQWNYDNSKQRTDSDLILPCCSSSSSSGGGGGGGGDDDENDDVDIASEAGQEESEQAAVVEQQQQQQPDQGTDPIKVAFDFTNDKITSCARSNRAAGIPWLTASNASYICTNEQWDRFYDPATSIAYAAQNPDADGPLTLSCPTDGQTIKCFVFASWGQVAGGPDACTDSCSTSMKSGAESCCGKACTSAGHSDVASAKCSSNKWVAGTNGSCGNHSKGFAGGYCDCCPNCYDCVHGPPPPETLFPTRAAPTATKLRGGPPAAAEAPARSNPRRSLVAARFCDCRFGLTVSPDYTPCWNSCLDCLGDDGDVSYMPDDVAASCVGGTSTCSFMVVEEGNSSDSNQWFKCSSSSPSSCTASTAGSVSVPAMPKLKVAALCGA